MKYFVISDIHGFYNYAIEDLKKAGYDKDNSNHTLIVCGDIFDRGTQPLEVYKFLRSIPKERRILIRGNHEILLRELVKRGYIESHDRHNGTGDTIYNLAGYGSEKFFISDRFKEQEEVLKTTMYDSAEYNAWHDMWYKKERAVYKNDLIKEILDWIASDEWVNYYETKDYIFVHSWIPVQEHYDLAKSLAYDIPIKSGPDTYREDWRNATQTEWEDAMWPCPWQNAKLGLNKTGKTIVCGHWHTSDFFNNLKNKNSTKKYNIHNNPIFKSKRYKLIGLDACTAVTALINVFIFEE